MNCNLLQVLQRKVQSYTWFSIKVQTEWYTPANSSNMFAKQQLPQITKSLKPKWNSSTGVNTDSEKEWGYMPLHKVNEWGCIMRSYRHHTNGCVHNFIWFIWLPASSDSAVHYLITNTEESCLEPLIRNNRYDILQAANQWHVYYCYITSKCQFHFQWWHRLKFAQQFDIT